MPDAQPPRTATALAARLAQIEARAAAAAARSAYPSDVLLLIADALLEAAGELIAADRPAQAQRFCDAAAALHRQAPPAARCATVAALRAGRHTLVP